MSEVEPKHSVKPQWTLGQVRHEAARMAAGTIVARMKMMEKVSPAQIKRFVKVSAKEKAKFFKSCGVKSPLDLVKFMAEHEVNMFGAKARIAGDENQALLINEKPTVWLEAKRLAAMNEKQEKAMTRQYETWMKELGSALGFSTRVQITKHGLGSTITFAQKKSTLLQWLFSSAGLNL
jgi:predicted RNA-binding protein Jag